MIEWGLGRVISIDSTALDANGNPTPVVNVLSFDDGTRLSIPLAPAAWEQSLPKAGYHVLYIRYGKHWSRIVKMWGVGGPTDRKGQYALDDGEVFIQAPLGLGFLKIDRTGRVSLCSGDTTATLDMSDEGVIGEARAYKFVTQTGLTLSMTDDGQVLLEKRSSDGETVEAVFQMDAEKNIMVQALGDVTIKAQNIYLDGKVSFGPGASDPSQQVLFGNVVTSGATGTHPFDYVTGAPIPGSTVVKAAR